MAAELVETAEYTSAPAVSVPCEYNARDLIIYSLGIGCQEPRYTYENDSDFAAFPTYPIVFMFKGTSYDVLSFPPEMMTKFPQASLPGIRGVLDAEKYIEKIEELPKTGAKLNVVGRTIGCHQKGKNGFVEQEFKITDDSGKEYYKIVSGAMMIGANGFKNSGTTYSVDLKPPKTSPTHSIEQSTDVHQTLLYRLSGDYNPLHVDPQSAKMFGFQEPILHGQCTMGVVARGLLEKLAGGDQRRFKSIQLRFASPVIPGQSLVTEIWAESPTSFLFQTKVKETGKVCVSNGRFVLTAESKL
jgi:3-hydroxyacyl-CoA dehydrogenase/3a,7a,12a-trihydroxy-5b-cholest-24-enoyl-CoA hydratase